MVRPVCSGHRKRVLWLHGWKKRNHTQFTKVSEDANRLITQPVSPGERVSISGARKGLGFAWFLFCLLFLILDPFFFLILDPIFYPGPIFQGVTLTVSILANILWQTLPWTNNTGFWKCKSFWQFDHSKWLSGHYKLRIPSLPSSHPRAWCKQYKSTQSKPALWRAP